MNNNELTKTMRRMDWDLFLRQKEWLYSQQCYLEKWYDVDASAFPEGILNMMDRIQEAWEDESDNPYWYVEVWDDADLEMALENAEVEVTKENVNKLKGRCQHAFDDKSARNEILADMARKLFYT
ncbi:MAG: hypothetical protein LUH58_02525 [Lachnospiraceae bacterium]|nr:hypothetical protein [Lachnospiraceae bacterium]